MQRARLIVLSKCDLQNFGFGSRLRGFKTVSSQARRKRNGEKEIQEVIDTALKEQRFSTAFREDFKKHFFHGYNSVFRSKSPDRTLFMALFNFSCSVSIFALHFF